MDTIKFDDQKFEEEINKIVSKEDNIINLNYDDLKIEFLFHSNHLEGSTFSKENLEKLLFDNSKRK